MLQLTAGGGLQNLGNTCFFNATLQSLLYTPALAHLFQEHGHSQHCHSKNWCVFCEMENIYLKTRHSRCFSPNNMINNLKKIFKKFKLGRQEDSHQFLRYLIEGMQESETGPLGKVREENEKKLRKTKVFEIFGGQIKTSVECLNCSHKSITEQRYYDFNIDKECQRANSLLEGVSSFFAIDKLEGSNKYLCEHCKTRSNARKRFVLETIPLVATFQMKRFTNNMRKIGKYIQYPYEIDLGKYLEKPRKVTLKLFAVIVHAGGSSFSGHYYAYVRVGTSWYKMDDSYVSKCNIESVMNQQAYILFYEREQHEENGIKVNGVKAVEKEKEKIVQPKENMIDQAKQKKQLKKVEEKPIIQIQTIKQKKQIKVTPPEVKLMNGVKQVKKTTVQAEQKQNKQNESNVQQLQAIKESVFKQSIQSLQNILIRKLPELLHSSNSQAEDIERAVKQAFRQVTPKKNGQMQQQQPEHDEQMEQIVLPGLQRRKSKQQMERQLPYGQLVFRTLDKIIQLQGKMPNTRPRNNAQRSMYNLRKYETIMQKKRKLG